MNQETTVRTVQKTQHFTSSREITVRTVRSGSVLDMVLHSWHSSNVVSLSIALSNISLYRSR